MDKVVPSVELRSKARNMSLLIRSTLKKWSSRLFPTTVRIRLGSTNPHKICWTRRKTFLKYVCCLFVYVQILMSRFFWNVFPSLVYLGSSNLDGLAACNCNGNQIFSWWFRGMRFVCLFCYKVIFKHDLINSFLFRHQTLVLICCRLSINDRAQWMWR